MLKRLLDSAVRSRRRYAIDREIILRVITINLMILWCLWWRHLFLTGQDTVQIGSELRHATGLILAKVTWLRCLAALTGNQGEGSCPKKEEANAVPQEHVPCGAWWGMCFPRALRSQYSAFLPGVSVSRSGRTR
ncbi:MAG: hypothetical protein IMZ44_20725 [Planctomycetes bacterium]|nr:hypothetical protein [Planctomycetota bacterium]